ncbi:hypothetical protein LW858_33665 (plasmid) [Bacillus cereus]|uniref:hypothetical protein n=1 Tax=Bacillus cereus TaxID=1396 RepID=UPI001F205684|nr:hypothetical protein [Bacillus cereus]UIJ70202.1 hypothetical protein LW858_33665 [Bacillus cereus]
MNIFNLSSSIFTSIEDLAKITTLVHSLFTSTDHTELAQGTTDYWIDQVMLKVNALSDTTFSTEKIMLQKIMMRAKQYSKSRNVLQAGNFENSEAWLLGHNAMIKSDNPLFKGNYLLLPPPTSLRPSYAYQKVEEVKLKSYTRYIISGFVAQCAHLEIVASRYDKEVNQILNIPYEEAFPITSDNQPNCCKPGSSSCSSTDSHLFNYTIDVGPLYSEDRGIEFGLRIMKPNGFAIVSNLEIREERPLTTQERKCLQRQEQEWKKKEEKQYAEIAKILQPIITKLNTFFKNENWYDTILSHVTYRDLCTIVLPTLSNQKHWFMEDRENSYYSALKQVKQAIEHVFTHLEEQNLIHNGSFVKGLENWVVVGDPKIILEKGCAMFHLNSWEDSISQVIDIINFDKDKEYVLRVVGKGSGIILLQNNGLVETISIKATDFVTNIKSFYLDDKTVRVELQSTDGEFFVHSIELIESENNATC